MPPLRPSSVVLTLVALAVPSAAQQVKSRIEPRMAPRWEIPGFDFSPNGGWRVKARTVAAIRARLLANRNFAELNAPAAGAPGGVLNGLAGQAAVSGTLKFPVIMFRYQDTPASQYSRDTAQYNATLFGSPPPNGKPYSLSTFYEQLSNGLFNVQGQSIGWVALANSESTYTGTNCQNPFGSTNCNGLFSKPAFAAMQTGLIEALNKVDSTVDFGQFDNDGPDGIPNSGDDDGYVDALLFLHPTMDGACVSATNNHLWSHRSDLYYTTNDNAHNGGKIVVADYILLSGVGSPSGGVCDSTAIMPIGTAAHELGHVLSLPDLYDVGGPTEGIGEWGLMGSGNYAKPESPARYDAWSLQQMGWTTIAPLTANGTYSLGPEPTADTVFYINVPGLNPRNEYFLIENRQAVESDSALIRIHGGGGLMIWHVDDWKACLLPCDYLNDGPLHAVVLEEADGQRGLWCDPGGICNRGDGGDPYPGTSINTKLSFNTNPAPTKNYDASFVGFALDSIRQLVPNGAMAFRLRYGDVTTVEANDTSAIVQVDGLPYDVFRNFFDDGSSHTIAVADAQFVAGGRTRLTFLSWSDSGAISHDVLGAFGGATYVATLQREHRLQVTVPPHGAVTYSPGADSSGTFLLQGTTVSLIATADPGYVFGGWKGDTSAANATLTLSMQHPYDLTAAFDSTLVVTTAGPRLPGIMGAHYSDSFSAKGGSGTYTWSVIDGTIPPFLTLGTDGQLTGILTQTGTFIFTARVKSGPQTKNFVDTVVVTAPTLLKSAVVAQILTGSSSLTPDELEYLDLAGNNNYSFDVGDFLAWVVATGATPAPPDASAVARGPGAPAVRQKGSRP